MSVHCYKFGLHELIKRDEVYQREICLAEHIEMAVLRYQIVGTGRKSTVHELIIVQVCGYQAHAEVWVNEPNIFLVENQQNDILCNGRRNLLIENLLILFQYLVRYAQIISPFEESVPYRRYGLLRAIICNKQFVSMTTGFIPYLL